MGFKSKSSLWLPTFTVLMSLFGISCWGDVPTKIGEQADDPRETAEVSPSFATLMREQAVLEVKQAAIDARLEELNTRLSLVEIDENTDLATVRTILTDLGAEKNQLIGQIEMRQQQIALKEEEMAALKEGEVALQNTINKLAAELGQAITRSNRPCGTSTKAGGG